MQEEKPYHSAGLFLSSPSAKTQIAAKFRTAFPLKQAFMQNPLIIGLIVFAIILIGAFVGDVMRQCLPKHQLSEETKSTVTVSMAVVATFSALVLGLLISPTRHSVR
jgi:hypothetical protein